MKTLENISLVAGQENSIFVWNSAFANNFNEMPQVNDDMIVVICNAHAPTITIYDTKGFSEEEILEVVKHHCSYVTSGCNYTYELVKKIGNCYFVN